ncbi:MAG: alpha/beta fold hydrolase [archaeon]
MEKKTALIIHGTAGSPGENWFPWLKGELEARGFEVFVPQFPTPENQLPENWFEIFDKYRGKLGPESILIGHSLGGAFLLRALETLQTKVKAVVIVAAPVGVLPIKYYETDSPFIGKPFDWGKIRASAGKFLVFHSENDQYICLGNGEKIAKELGVQLTLIPGGKHLNGEAGFLKFDKLLERIDSEILEK